MTTATPGVPVLGEVFYPSFEQVRDSYLRIIAYGGQRRGITLNTLQGSEYWYRARAIAGQITPVFSNNKVSVVGMDPTKAVGDDLIGLAAAYGVFKRAAAPASGLVQVRTIGGAIVPIPDGFQCTAADGSKYTTVGASTVGDLDTVLVVASIGGAAGNKPVGSTITWDSSVIGFLKRNATVSGNGLTNGVEADSEEVLRSRLLSRLSSPGFGGNAADVKRIAENSSASIAAAFVYPAIQGPGSQGLALVSATGDRTVSSVVVSTAAQAVATYMPGFAKTNATTVTPQQLDVIFRANLALPTVAGGTGGGWRDATPWPNAASGNVKVTSYTTIGGTTTAVTDATILNGLQVGTQIGIWDPAALAMREYTVSNVTLSGTYRIQVVGVFLNDPTGAYISAGAERLTGYATAMSAAFLGLGPGEKSTDPNIVPRALRKPAADATASYTAGSLLPASVTAAFPEIISLDYANSYTTGTTTPQTTPTVPVVSTDPPGILVLKNLAFRQA